MHLPYFKGMIYQIIQSSIFVDVCVVKWYRMDLFGVGIAARAEGRWFDPGLQM